MNCVILTGNLTDDPKMHTTRAGVNVCSLRLAVKRRFPNQDGKYESDFFPIVAWRQTAELCVKYLKKGGKCTIRGSLQTRNYEGNDGVTRYITEIVADEVEFLPSGSKNGQPGGTAPEENEGFTQVDDDELPF